MSRCLGCNYDLEQYYDFDSNCCTNCGVVSTSFGLSKLPEQSHDQSYVSKSHNNDTSSTSSNLIRWGWNSRQSIRNTDSSPTSRNLDSQYFAKEMLTIKSKISSVARLLRIPNLVERASYLTKLAFEKKLDSGKYFKFGEEGVLIGLSCLYISSQEEGFPLEIASIPNSIGLDIYKFGSIYKKVRFHLGIVPNSSKESQLLNKILKTIYTILMPNFTSLAEKSFENSQFGLGATIKTKDATKSKTEMFAIIQKSLSPALEKSLSETGIKGIAHLSSKIMVLASESLIFIGKNIKFVIGSAIFLAIQFIYLKNSHTKPTIATHHKNLLIKLVSSVCNCSESIIKSNSKLIIDLIIKVSNDFEWLIGRKVDSKNIYILAEKVIDASIKMKKVSNDHEVENKNKSQILYSSAINNPTIPTKIDSNSISNNPKLHNVLASNNKHESFRNCAITQNTSLSNPLDKSPLNFEDMNSSSNTAYRNQDSPIDLPLSNFNFLEDNLNNVFESIEELDFCQCDKSDDSITPNNLCRCYLEEGDMDWEKIKNSTSSSNPKKFSENQNLRNSRYNEVTRYLLANNNSLCLFNTNDEFSLSKKSKSKTSEFLKKIYDSLNNGSNISDIEILAALFVLDDKSTDLFFTLPIHTCRDLLISKLRARFLQSRDLDNPQVTEADIPDTEIGSYLRFTSK
ncbi:hypothetical protein AYI69_g10395 [Smittium culicis]|uniref:Uncharacterized protein n=1 Tax=Smittium culicis TaxID=133412 RepID=A0A1R1X618_9FUNG|nr:hypothetical protein AYI69_g10395 [Smittium culicis]